MKKIVLASESRTGPSAHATSVGAIEEQQGLMTGRYLLALVDGAR
jgi:hypothetical protein